MTIRWIKDRIDNSFLESGVRIGGQELHDIKVIDPGFYSMIALGGASGFADAYVNGYWECSALDVCVFKLLQGGAIDRLKWYPDNLLRFASDALLNKQRPGKVRGHIHHHYDLGEVFRIMLDSTRVYSCARWDKAKTLEEAQIAKLNLVCHKLGLKPGMNFCDIGCGWGALLFHAARIFGCNSTGITLSLDQYLHIKFLDTKGLNLPDGVFLSARLDDYRSLGGHFDRIASVGMFEHVGQKNYRRFMRSVSDHMANDGLFLLHTIGAPDSSPTLKQPELAWIGKNIFPGAVLPSLNQMSLAARELFDVLDVECFDRIHYDRTLLAWAKNFEAGWPSIKNVYDDDFYRMWRYYLYACAAMFRSGRIKVWQIVLAKPGFHEDYVPVDIDGKRRLPTLE